MNTITWLVWLLAALVLTGLTNNPPYLVLALLAATLVFLACRDDRPLANAYRLLFSVGLAIFVGSIIFSVITVGGGRGRTVLATLPSLTLPALLGGVTLGGPITAEDIAWGAVRGLRIWTLLAIFGAFNALVDHYRLLRRTPRALFHAGLAVTIAVSFVPQTVRAIAEISEAQRIRGQRQRKPRDYVALVAPLLASSLEKSIQLAEALDARGYGRTQAGDRTLRRWQLGLLGGLLLLGAGLFGWLYYGEQGAAPSLALLAAGLATLALAMRGLGNTVPRTAYRAERWHRRDYAVIIASLVCSAGWVAVRVLDGGSLAYVPYPLLTLPPFAPLAGGLTLLLAVPALFGSAPSGERRVTHRVSRGHQGSTRESRHEEHTET